MPAPAKSAFYSTGDISGLIGLSPTSIRRLAAENPQALPPFMRVGSVLRFPRTAAESWLAERLAPKKKSDEPLQHVA